MTARRLRFQSSPNPKVGCHSSGYSASTMGHSMFQSSPNPKVGCHQVDIHVPFLFFPVSILTQPEGWVPSCLFSFAVQMSGVSILTQPEGWVPLYKGGTQRGAGNVSILTQPEGWVPLSLWIHRQRGNVGFNPHPTRRLGAIWGRKSGIGSWYYVSILTQPEGWVPSMARHGVAGSP